MRFKQFEKLFWRFFKQWKLLLSLNTKRRKKNLSEYWWSFSIHSTYAIGVNVQQHDKWYVVVVVVALCECMLLLFFLLSTRFKPVGQSKQHGTKLSWTLPHELRVSTILIALFMTMHIISIFFFSPAFADYRLFSFSPPPKTLYATLALLQNAI